MYKLNYFLIVLVIIKNLFNFIGFSNNVLSLVRVQCRILKKLKKNKINSYIISYNYIEYTHLIYIEKFIHTVKLSNVVMLISINTEHQMLKTFKPSEV